MVDPKKALDELNKKYGVTSTKKANNKAETQTSKPASSDAQNRPKQALEQLNAKYNVGNTTSADSRRIATRNKFSSYLAEENTLKQRQKEINEEIEKLRLRKVGSDRAHLGQYSEKIDKEIAVLQEELNSVETDLKKYKYNDYLDDINDDNFAGQFKSNYSVGRMTQDSNAAWNEYIKNPTKENYNYAKYIDLVSEQYQTNNAESLDDDGWIRKSAANYLPQFLDQFKAGAAGVVAGAGTAFAAGSLLPIPEEIFTVPTGAKVGITAAMGKYSYDNMRGAAYRSLIQEGVEEQTARALANDEAILSSLIEMVDTGIDIATLGVGNLLKNASKLGIKGTAKIMAKRGSEEAAESALRKFAKAAGMYGINIGSEALQEASQEVISMANLDRAGTGESGFWNLAGSSIDKALNLSAEEGQRVRDAASEGARIAAMFGGGTMALTSAANAGIQYGIDSNVGKQIRENDGVEGLISYGLENNQDTKTYKYASKLQQRQDAGKNIRNSQVGKLFRTAGSDMQAPGAVPVQKQQMSHTTGDTVTDRYSNAMKSLGEKGRVTVGSYFKDGGTLEGFDEFYANYSRYYELGATNLPEAEVRKLNPTAEQMTAYYNGKNDAQSSLAKEKANAQYATAYGKSGGLIQNKTSSAMDRSLQETLNAVGKAVGVKIAMAESIRGGTANGQYADGVVTIAKDSDNPYFVVAKHEITHHMQKVAPTQYRKYRDYAVKVMSSGNESSVTLVEKYKRLAANSGVTLATEQAMDEIAADFTEAIIKDEKKLKKFVSDGDKNVVRRFFRSVRDFINKVKKVFRGNRKKMDQAAQEQFGATIEQLEHAEKLWLDALKAAQEKVNELGNVDHVFVNPVTGESVQWSLRTKKPPKKTIFAYKAFYAHDGKLYPPMVSNPSDETRKISGKIKKELSGTVAGQETPVGVWLDADVGGLGVDEDGNVLRTAKTGRIRVQNDQGGGTLAFRPGWHLGEWPDAKQFNRGPLVPYTNYKGEQATRRMLMPDGIVFAKCEIAADVDYQIEAMEYGMSEKTDKKGRTKSSFSRSQAGLPRVPEDGYYKYRTNVDPTTAPWYITGAMRVVEILDDDDCARICAEFGVVPDKRVSGKKINLADYGLKRGPVVPTEEVERFKKSQRNLDNETLLEKALSDPEYDYAYKRGKIDFDNPEIRKEFEMNKQDADYYREQYEKGDKQYSLKNNTFYSKMERVVEGTKQTKLGASSVIPMLKGKGVKDEEIKWTGLKVFLEGKKSVTKDELLEFIQGNQLEIKEEIKVNKTTSKNLVELTGLWHEIVDTFATTEEIMWSLDENYDSVENQIYDDIEEGYISEEDGQRLLEAMNNYIDSEENTAPNTQWHEHKLDGGGNYREFIFKLPDSDYTNEAMRTHWNDRGVLAHARVQDFNVDGGKMLFVEEIQSDWHNEGQKVGYQKDEAVLKENLEKLIREQKKQRELLMPELVENFKKMRYDNPENIADIILRKKEWADIHSETGVLSSELSEKVRKYYEIVLEKNKARRLYFGNMNLVEDAPFRNTYHEYVMKRLIREAAAGGYDSIGWTTGKIQEQRWSGEYAEGYRIEYDQDIPKFLRKYGKQWGATVGKTKIQSNNLSFEEQVNLAAVADILEDGDEWFDEQTGSTEVWKMDITDDMYESVMYYGQPMFSLKQPAEVKVGDEDATYEVDGVRYSLKSAKHDIDEGKMFDDLVKVGVFTRKEADKFREKLTELIDYMLPNANILDMNEGYTRGNRPYSAYKPNSDPLYVISLDFSTLCRKRLMTQYVIEQLQLRENRPMSAEEQMAIRSMLLAYRQKENALQVACAMCYVEAARMKAPKQMEKFFDNTESIMKKHFAKKDKMFNAKVIEAQKQFKIEHGYDAGDPKSAMSNKDKKAFDKLSLDMRNGYVPNAEQQAIIDTAVGLSRSNFLTASNLTELSIKHPEIYDAYTSHIRASTRSKGLESDIPYYYGDSQGAVSDSFVEKVNAENGMRFDSWSDFQMKHMLDMIVAVVDLSVRGSKMHGYTKFPEMVRIFGKTGMMFNLSGVAEDNGFDADGNLIFSDTESIDFDEAIQLREDYPETAGLQCIGVSDEHVRALLRSDDIDYVIPYHVSGMNATLRRMAGIHGWQDYTKTQEAKKDPNAKKPDDAENWQVEPVWSEFYVTKGKDGYDIMQKTARKYIELCRERGLIPKFNDFTDEPGYWKLLIDRKMVNQKTGEIIKQKPVRPDFDFDLIKEEIDREVSAYDPKLEQNALNYVVENFDAVQALKKQKNKKAMQTMANEIYQAYAEGSQYSLKGQSNLLKENARLKEYNEYLKEQMKVTKFVKKDRKAIDKLAKSILKEYGSNADSAELASQLTDMYDAMGTWHGKNTLEAWEDVKAAAHIVAQSILTEATVTNDELYQSYKGLRDHLRNTKIFLDEDYRSDLQDGYNNFRKANFGRIKLANDGVPVDTAYQELAEMYPEFFDPEEYTHPADQLQHIAGVLDSLQPYEENPYDYDMQNASDWLANEIIHKFAEVPDAKKTYADKQADKIRKIREESKKKIRAAVEKEKAAKWEKVAQVKKQYKDKESRMSERRKKSVYMNKIRKHVDNINKMLINPTDTGHVPESLRRPVAEFLSIIDLSTDRLGEKALNRLNALQKEYQKILDGKTDYMLEVDPDLIDNIEAVIEAVTAGVKDKAGMRIIDMNLSDMEAMYRATLAIESSIYTFNRMLNDAKTQTISEYGENALTDLKTKKPYLEHKNAAKRITADLLNMEMLAPLDYFEELGGTMSELYQDIRDGFDTKINRLQEGKKYIKTLLSGADIKSMSGDKAKAKTFRITNGSITLTPAQVMSLYLLNKQSDAQNHIYGGGIKAAPVVAITEKSRKPKITKSFETLQVLPEDVANITASLTPQQKKIADGISEFFVNNTAEWGNEVSLKLYGYRKFTVENYFPIVSDRNYIAEVFGETNDMTLKNMGSTKSRIKGAKNPLIIEDVFDVYARQVDSMSSYNAFVIPLTDIQRVYNYKTPEGSVKQAVEKKFGVRAHKYFSKIMTDINGGAKYQGGWEFMNTMISRYKQARIGSNLRVILQQPTAMFRAMSMINPKYLATGLTPKRVNYERVMTYAPIARWKDWGHFSMDTSKSMKDIIIDKKELSDYTMWATGFADRLTWGRIWNAVESETKAKHPDLKVGSDEYYQAAGKRFSEIIDRTQVVDSTLHRTQIMRNPDTAVKMSVAFMSEPMKSYNMLRTALRNAKTNPSGTTKKAAFAASISYLTAITVNHIITGLIDTLRGDDDDEFMLDKLFDVFRGKYDEDDENETLTFTERWIKHFADNLMNEPLSMIPGLKDAISIVQGFTVERMDMAGVADIVQAAQRAISDKYTIGFKVIDISSKIADVFGIPLSNIKRETETAAKLLLNTKDDPVIDYKVSKLLYLPAANKGKYMDILYDALKSGDTEAYNYIAQDLINSGATDAKKIESAMKSRAKKDTDTTDVDSFNPTLAGVGLKYANPVEEEEETKFKVEDLSGSQYTEYAEIKGENLEEIIGELQTNAFSDYDEETQNKLINAAYTYANSVALQEASNGAYKEETKWIGYAQNAEYDLGISVAEYIEYKEKYGDSAMGNEKLKAAVDYGIDVETYFDFRDKLKEYDENGNKSYSQEEATNAIAAMPGLTNAERAFLWQSVNKSWKSRNNPWG